MSKIYFKNVTYIYIYIKEIRYVFKINFKYKLHDTVLKQTQKTKIEDIKLSKFFVSLKKINSNKIQKMQCNISKHPDEGLMKNRNVQRRQIFQQLKSSTEYLFSICWHTHIDIY